MITCVDGKNCKIVSTSAIQVTEKRKIFAGFHCRCWYANSSNVMDATMFRRLSLSCERNLQFSSQFYPTLSLQIP